MKTVSIAVLLVAFVIHGASLGQQDRAQRTTRETAPDPAQIELTPVADGFERPVFVTHADDGSNRLFVVEQFGKIWVIEDGVRLEPPFLDIKGLLTQSAFEHLLTERGLLGLAFHPNYLTNGRLHINYTDVDGDTVVARYHVTSNNPNIAHPGSAAIILQVDQPDKEHNGGHLAFGADGYLYIALGDGAFRNDPLGAGQNTQILLGSILRIDIDGGNPYSIPNDNPFVNDDNGLDEIWVYGLRNPWRFSFDRQNGDMYIGDVGQAEWEEVNFQPGDSTGGENFGWKIWEGRHLFGSGTAENYIAPIFDYSHSEGCSVAGGYVYRGDAIPDLQAVYLFGDWCTGLIWASYRDTNLEWQSSKFLETGLRISSFGEDEDGEIYVVDYSGTIYRIDPALPS